SQHDNGDDQGDEAETETEEPDADAPDADAPDEDAGDGDSGDAPTGDHPANHGKVVSEAAQGETPDGFDNHGAYVRTIAKDNAGHQDAGSGDEDAGAGDEDAGSGDEDSGDGDAAPTTTSTKEHGKGKSH